MAGGAQWRPGDLSVSRAQGNLLTELFHRLRQFPLHCCWLVDTKIGRFALLVPTGDGLERLRAVSPRTLTELHERGLIEYGEDHRVPSYRFAKPGDQCTGQACTITLTKAGFDFCSAGKAQT
jgi:hypothetical protein